MRNTHCVYLLAFLLLYPLAFTQTHARTSNAMLFLEVLETNMCLDSDSTSTGIIDCFEPSGTFS